MKRIRRQVYLRIRYTYTLRGQCKVHAAPRASSLLIRAPCSRSDVILIISVMYRYYLRCCCLRKSSDLIIDRTTTATTSSSTTATIHRRPFARSSTSLPTSSKSLSSSISTTNSMAVPCPSVAPPYRRRVVHIKYEIYDKANHNHHHQHNRKKESRFIFTASYDVNDDPTKAEHSDDYCGNCQTVYFKRYAAASNKSAATTATEVQQRQKSNTADKTSIDTKNRYDQRLTFVEAHGEVRRVCTYCKGYFHALIDNAKEIIGKREKN